MITWADRLSEIRRTLLTASRLIFDLQQKVIDHQQEEIAEMRAALFDLETELDRNRIDTSADPKPCPKCGSMEHDLICVRCGYSLSV